MKKILSIAVLLMTALVGFTACNNDDENLSLAKSTFTATMHANGEAISNDMTYTISFNDASQCVMRIESRNIKVQGVDKPFSKDTFYGGTYTQSGNTVTFNVDCITTENGTHSFSITDRPETHTLTYNPDTKVLTFEDGSIELKSTTFTPLECKKYPLMDTAIKGMKLEDVLGKTYIDENAWYWEGGRLCLAKALLNVDEDGIASFAAEIYDYRSEGRVKSFLVQDKPIEINGLSFIVGGWECRFKSFDANGIYAAEIYDPNGKLFVNGVDLTLFNIYIPDPF